MSIDPSELELITSQVWELMMGSEIAPAPPTRLPQQVAPSVAHVDLTGAYSGTVALHIDDGLVRTAAATMFGIAREEVDRSEMEDAARELANMVGGNVKCLVAQPTDLGLPSVTPAAEFYAARADADRHLGFEFEGAGLQVFVYDAVPNASA